LTIGSFFGYSAESVFAAKDAQQYQQALEDVEQVQVQRQGCADVVGLTSVQHTLEVIKHVGAEDADDGNGQRQHARRGADKDVARGRA